MKKRKISLVIMQWLIVCLLLAFTVATVVIYVTNTNVAKKNTIHLLGNSIDDVLDELEEHDSITMIQALDKVCEQLEDVDTWNSMDNSVLYELSRSERIPEINVIDGDARIAYSTVQAFRGFDMRSTDQSNEFVRQLIEDDTNTYFLQDVRQRGADKVSNRYIARRFAFHKGFVQLGFDEEKYYKYVINTLLENSTRHRRIGDRGSIYVVESDGNVISAPVAFSGKVIDDAGIEMENLKKQTVNTLFVATVNGERHFCMCDNYSGRYYIIAMQPIEEGTMARDLVVKMNSVNVLLIFILLIIMIYLLIKRRVVKNINVVNNKLASITKGNLDEVVDVRDTLEFDSLSTDINMTVNSLKEYIHEAETRFDADLLLARSIQMASLPNVFPAFPGHKEMDIFASTIPAKEVGGDFYDFYFTSKNKVAIVIADVSGKGIPAAMFMMRGKSSIKNMATSGRSVCSIMDSANSHLCQNNDTNTFITVWMGIIDITTGDVQYVNAGHNAPLLRRSNGLYEYIENERPQLPLGAFDGIPYTMKTLHLEPGDELFLYTDGVTEAENVEKQLYGDAKLRDTLNNLAVSTALDPTKTCHAVLDSIHDFAIGAEQSDDITMLCFRFNG